MCFNFKPSLPAKISIIHNNVCSSESIPCCPLTSKSIDIFVKNSFHLCLICAYFSHDSEEMTFSTRIINIMNRGLEWEISFEWVVWIIVMFLSTIWTLILTAPIHYRGSILSKWFNATFLILFRWRNKLFYIWDGLRESTFFRWTMPLTSRGK